ncbi:MULTISPECIES: MmgE/PrpD family protein [Streptomyces]|uniref:MmgE/PrpD family protein n=1 Tax=Streptomyces TaxID=1883 RepID=UPI000D673D6A|nr:MmgE/PrpD family protein [Streptomyces sp. NWU49]PWJ04720.1 VlmK-like protein [Streptomyces sp. NWU49]
MSILKELCRWAAWLRPEDIPPRVRALASSQLLSQLASIRAGAAHPLGRRLIEGFGPPLQADPRNSACVLAGLGSWLNLDDTAYAGHLSNSTVSVPLAFAHARGLDGPGLLTAVVAANECAARITAAATLGPLRGHSAVHTHLAGAVTGRLHCEGADDAVWSNALGLAFAMPNWPLMRAFLASDARLFNTFTPVRTAMDSCDAARAGLRGAVDILEHPDGFLDRFASVPLPDAVSAGLGERWHTETLSFKLHPGGPGIDAAVDCATALYRRIGPCRPEDIEEVVVEASLYTLFAGKKAASYVAGPGSPLGALVLHTPYPVATALLTGGLTVNDFAAPLLNERARWDLAERVRLVHDPELTKALFASEAPFGEAVRQAGKAAGPWLRAFAGDEAAELAQDAAGDRERATFASSAKATGARVTVRLTDGRTVSQQRLIPMAAAGPHTRAHHAELMREKFVEFGGAPDVADAAADLESMDADALQSWIEAALR